MKLVLMLCLVALTGCGAAPLTQQQLKQMLEPGLYWGEFCRLNPNDRQCVTRTA